MLHACVLSSLVNVRLFATLQTVALQAPLSMGFSRQEYWSRQPFPSPGDLPTPEVEPGSPGSPALQVDSIQTKPNFKLCLPLGHFERPVHSTNS